MDRNEKGQFLINHESFKKPSPKCTIEKCDRISFARKLCTAHYQRWKKYGNPIEPYHWLGRPKGGAYFTCKCGKEFYRPSSCVKLGRTKFCSKHCAALSSRGVSRNSIPIEKRWRKNKKGYIFSTIRRKRIMQHRYVVEKHIGRPLQKHEIIHHINGIKTDNRIENLHITNNKEHPMSYGNAYMDGYRKGLEDAKKE
ncbi:homing endonuclease [Caudoviricetes sp.]|nr:homing endonuclease [Caudoviricetes sp.]UOF80990.1 homing endonuclease [Caudoviricetes sp.]UOF81377.1 homing endonuclease [Caudoviricetes sp.]